MRLSRRRRREPNVYITTFRHGIEVVRKVVPDASEGWGVQTSAAHARERGVEITPDMYQYPEMG